MVFREITKFVFSQQRKNSKRFELQDTQITSLESVTGVWNLHLSSELVVESARHITSLSCSMLWKDTIVPGFWQNFI